MSVAGAQMVADQSVSRETSEALSQLEGLVQRWNPAINLVSKASLLHLRDRHILDSAQIFGHAPVGARHWVDLGSGGGFPGLVVAILAKEKQPQLHFTLVESDARKATFLRQAARELGLSVEVLAQRIESVPELKADVLSARALAPLSALLGYAERHLQPDGVAIFPKGERFADELAEARRHWKFEVDCRPSLSDPGAAILVIRKIERAHET